MRPLTRAELDAAWASYCAEVDRNLHEAVMDAYLEAIARTLNGRPLDG